MDKKLEKLKKVFEATLQAEDKKLYTALRIPPLVSFLGIEYAKNYTKRREEAQIHLKSLRFFTEIKTEAERPLKEVRYLSAETTKYSMVIWENNVVSVSDNLEVVAWTQDQATFKKTLQWFEDKWSKSNQ